MCTAINVRIPKGSPCFGRTMDFSYPLVPELYQVPRGYEWENLLKTHRFQNRYGFLGIGQDLSPIAFADGVNERGFAAAALYFPGYAKYGPHDSRGDARPPVAAIEMVGFLLAMCASVEHASEMLNAIRIVGLKDPVTDSVAPLHWITADAGGNCMVVEQTAEGLRRMENPIGVLSNSPDFQWHLTNLRNYMNVTPFQRPEQEWGPLSLAPFGQGAGTGGLPGDYTPPARFVRTAYQISHAVIPQEMAGAVNTCFHLLEGVSIPKGVVMTERGTADYTQYTAVIDLAAREYHIRTYDDSRTVSEKLSADRACSRIVSLRRLVEKTVL